MLYSAAQVLIIKKCVRKGLTGEQIALLSDPSFTPEQMREIYYAWRDNISIEDVKMLAKPELALWQMQLIHTGIIRGIPYKEIVPLINPDKLSQEVAYIHSDEIALRKWRIENYEHKKQEIPGT